MLFDIQITPKQAKALGEWSVTDCADPSDILLAQDDDGYGIFFAGQGDARAAWYPDGTPIESETTE